MRATKNSGVVVSRRFLGISRIPNFGVGGSSLDRSGPPGLFYKLSHHESLHHDSFLGWLEIEALDVLDPLSEHSFVVVLILRQLCEPQKILVQRLRVLVLWKHHIVVRRQVLGFNGRYKTCGLLRNIPKMLRGTRARALLATIECITDGLLSNGLYGL